LTGKRRPASSPAAFRLPLPEAARAPLGSKLRRSRISDWQVSEVPDPRRSFLVKICNTLMVY
jgi:hypothetical protein